MEIRRLQEFGQLRVYKRGQIVFKIGDDGSDFYIILKGAASLRYMVGQRIKTVLVEAGNFFGETSALSNILRINTCVIEEDGTALICIPNFNFQRFISEDPEFAMRIMTFLSRQYLETMGERNNYFIRLQKHETVEIESADDMFKPVTPVKVAVAAEKLPEVFEKGKSVPVQAGAALDKTAEEPEMNGVMESPVALSLQKMIRLEIAPSGHRMYDSVKWPEAGKFLSPKPMQCPVCEQTFTATYLSRSKLRVINTSRDRRRFYKDIEPMYFELYTCGKCGYSQFADEFEKLRRAAKPPIARVLTGIGALPADMDEKIFDINYVFLKMYLAVLCTTMMGETLALPKIWIRLSWLYDEVKDEKLSLFAVKQAYDTYAHLLYNTKLLTGEAERDVMLLMGELAVKLDMEKEAAKFFWDVLQAKGVSAVQRRKAEERLYDIRHKDEM